MSRRDGGWGTSLAPGFWCDCRNRRRHFIVVKPKRWRPPRVCRRPPRHSPRRATSGVAPVEGRSRHGTATAGWCRPKSGGPEVRAPSPPPPARRGRIRRKRAPPRLKPQPPPPSRRLDATSSLEVAIHHPPRAASIPKLFEARSSTARVQLPPSRPPLRRDTSRPAAPSPEATCSGPGHQGRRQARRAAGTPRSDFVLHPLPRRETDQGGRRRPRPMLRGVRHQDRLSRRHRAPAPVRRHRGMHLRDRRLREETGGQRRSGRGRVVGATRGKSRTRRRSRGNRPDAERRRRRGTTHGVPATRRAGDLPGEVHHHEPRQPRRVRRAKKRVKKNANDRHV